MDMIIAGQRPGDEGAAVYEGLAVELPPVEPTVADLVAIEAGVDIQERLERLDVAEAQLRVAGLVDELAVRRARRERARELAVASAELGGAA